METQITETDRPHARTSRLTVILTSLVILLGLTTLVQTGILAKIKAERDGTSLGQALRAQMGRLIPGHDRKVKEETGRASESQVIYWDTTDDLDQIHKQISRLLRSLTFPFSTPPTRRNPFSYQISRNDPAQSRPYSPPDLEQLQQEIERIFEEVSDANQHYSLPARVNRDWDMVRAAAAMNIEEQGTNYIVTIALNGYRKQDIAVALTKRLLTVTAHSPDHRRAPALGGTTLEHNGGFHTQILLPENIDETRAQATYRDDLLRVQIPKLIETNSLARQIAIH